jgi:hypothetical protein
LAEPHGIALDSRGRLLIANRGMDFGHTVVRFDPRTPRMLSLHHLLCVPVFGFSKKWLLVISSTDVPLYALAGQPGLRGHQDFNGPTVLDCVSTPASSPSSSSSMRLACPSSIALDSIDNVYITDTNNHAIRVLTGTV